MAKSVKPYVLWVALIALPLYFAMQPLATSLLSAFPVVGNFSYEVVRHNETTLEVHVWGEKYRACDLVSVTAYTRYEGYTVKLPKIEFLADEGEGMSGRHEGTHDFGIWRVNTSIIKGGINNIQFVAEHNCGAPFDQITLLGDWRV